MIATSIRIEPTIVNSTNLVVAYRRCLPPQMPIRKYIGISTASQKK